MVQCDETKPRCQRCAKAGIYCAGYEAFRDQTVMVKNRLNRQKHGHGVSNRSYYGHIREGSSPVGSNTELDQHQPIYAVAARQQRLSRTIPQCPEQASIGFYLSHLIPHLPGYFTDELPELFANARSSSILSIVTIATSLSFTALHPQCAHYRTLAISKYAEALRSVREGSLDPVVARSDEFLVATLLLGVWEHSRSLALEPSQKFPHIMGAVAILKSRPPQHSLRSRLSYRLFRFVRADLIYVGIESADSKLLDDFLGSTLSVSPEIEQELSTPTDNEFCELAEFAINVPRLLARSKTLLSHASPKPGEVTALLQELEAEDAVLASWTTSSPRHRPWSSRPSTRKTVPGHSYHPPRVDIYASAPCASSCNSWRLCRVLVLDAIAHAARLLAESAEEQDANAAVRNLIDDICASMPYYLGYSDDYSSAEGGEEGRVEDGRGGMREEEMIANWSQMKSILSKGAEMECVPREQREWMRGYLGMFSKGGRGR